MEHTQTSNKTLRERYVELAEHIQEPYLSDQRKKDIAIEMGRISFELGERQKESLMEIISAQGSLENSNGS